MPVTTNYDIWKNNPEKVFGVTRVGTRNTRKPHLAVIKALIRAGKWLDATDAKGKLVNRQEACEILARPEYVGADVDVIDNSMTGTFVFQKTDVREMPDFNVFFKYNASFPHYSDCIWFLTQMRRLGSDHRVKACLLVRRDPQRKFTSQQSISKLPKLLIDEGFIAEDEVPADDYDGYREATSELHRWEYLRCNRSDRLHSIVSRLAIPTTSR